MENYSILEKPVYINPFTDFGFKKLFGTEVNKEFLKDFLNSILHDLEGEIVEISYATQEQLGITDESRRAIFDIYCTNERGEHFIVEMQKTQQKYFKERSLFYSTFPLQRQALKGKEWDFNLKAVYLVAILDFVFDDDEYPEKYRHVVKLKELETNKIWYEKLTFLYLEMPKFNKDISELKENDDKWLYVLKNMPILDKYPVSLQNKIFEKFFEVAQIAKLNFEEVFNYEMSLSGYRDYKNSIDFAAEKAKDKARAEGLAEGLAEGKHKKAIETAINLMKLGILTNDQISQATGLSIDEIENIL